MRETTSPEERVPTVDAGGTAAGEVGTGHRSIPSEERGGATPVGSAPAVPRSDGARLTPEPSPGAQEESPSSRDLPDIGAQVVRLVELFEERLTYDRFKEKQIDQLHEELQGHRRDLLSRTLRPLLLGLVQVHDELGRAREVLGTQPPGELNPGSTTGVLEDLQDDLELLLDQYGVCRSESSDDRFEPRIQTAARTLPTDDPALIGRVARRLHPGFAMNGTPLKKERVEVFVAADRTTSAIGERASSPPEQLFEEEPR